MLLITNLNDIRCTSLSGMPTRLPAISTNQVSISLEEFEQAEAWLV